jgi:anti-sigma-K factor RskA
MDHDQVLELVPLYALDALDEVDAREVEAHVATCDSCASELAVHHTVSAGLSVDEPPPSGVWERIAGDITDPDADTVIDLGSERQQKRSRITWLTVVAAIAALLLGAVAIFQTAANNELTGPEGIVAAAEAAAQEPGAIVTEFTTESGTIGQVVLTADGEGYVIPSELEPLGPDRTYQLWVITPDEVAISAGVLGSEPGPSRFTWTAGVAGFALTREVAGGVVSSAGDVVSVANV